MTPHEFIAKWKNAELKESAASQEQFIDLCRLLDEPTPAEADPKGDWYAFEKGALKTGGGDGWADVWKRGCFAWEYKGKGKDLDAAFTQLQRYAIALENPPLLIVSDMERFRIHTNWTNTVQDVIEISLEELADDRRRRVLKRAFSETDVNHLKPRKTRQELTEQVAAGFAQLAQRLRDRGHLPEQVAHFVNRLVFCMFAEDVDLLPKHMFRRMLEESLRKPAEFETHAGKLFAAMKSGGPVGFERVEWFNGGLFDDDRTLPLTEDDIKQTLDVARLDWSNIDPSIMGTLFERGLDPDKRSQLGAHYTDRDKIMLIVNPVIVEPLTREWEETRTKIEVLMERHHTHKSKGEKTKAYNEAQRLHRAFLDRLKNFRVLDPACGSGNFLYLSLLELKNLEHRANLDAEALGLPREFPSAGPQCVKGIEINPFAAELARVSVWIGEIQWMKRNGFEAARSPILKPLETIECRDALLNPDGTDAEWPEADVIVGNPPFLGSRKLQPELGSDYVKVLREQFRGRVPRGADLVCFWFAKASSGMKAGQDHRTGLVATNSISGGASREVLDAISEEFDLYAGWRDEPWTVEGAAVRVAIVCFARRGLKRSRKLDGHAVFAISSDLREIDPDREVIEVKRIAALGSNLDRSFQGVVPRSSVKRSIAKELGLPKASFVVAGVDAREMLTAPLNPNGRPNSDVIGHYLVGEDITRRPLDRFVVNFLMTEGEAALYEKPFEHIRPVKAHRAVMTQASALEAWWQYWRTRPELQEATRELQRFIATPRVSKYRLFVWCQRHTVPDNAVVVVARSDDTTFGVLQSRFHEIWSLRMCT